MTVPTDLDLRFREAAARSGMLDAGYDLVDSPIGPLLVAATDRGLLRISFDPDLEQHLEWLSRVAGRNVLRAPRQVDPARRELDEYFEGRRHAFDLAVDLRDVTPFTERVLHGARPDPVRRDGDLRRARRRGRATRRPRARSG